MPSPSGRYLREQGWDQQIVNLVAHHSGARVEAAERGLAHELADFPFADSPLLDALVTADLTTGPGGERLTYDERIAEILSRYKPGDVVHETWTKAADVIREAVNRTAARMSAAQPR